MPLYLGPMVSSSHSPNEQVELLYAQASKDAERLRLDSVDRAELARIAEETGDADAWPSAAESHP